MNHRWIRPHPFRCEPEGVGIPAYRGDQEGTITPQCEAISLRLILLARKEEGRERHRASRVAINGRQLSRVGGGSAHLEAPLIVRHGFEQVLPDGSHARHDDEGKAEAEARVERKTHETLLALAELLTS